MRTRSSARSNATICAARRWMSMSASSRAPRGVADPSPGRGADGYLWGGEGGPPPMQRLWSDRRVLITPHISNGSDQNQHGGVDVFCDNLRAYREGGTLHNVIDWQRGY